MSRRAHADGETNDMPRKMTGRDCAKLADFTTDMRQGVARLPEAYGAKPLAAKGEKSGLAPHLPMGTENATARLAIQKHFERFNYTMA